MTSNKLATRFFLIGAALILLQLEALTAWPAQTAPSRASGLTDQQWREDIDFLAKTVAEKHRHPFDLLSRADFDKAVAALRDRIPALADHEVVVGMIKLVAMLRDGHSRLTLPVGPAADTQSHTPTAAPKTGMAFHILPFRLYLFSDGLYVQAATPEHRDLVGARIVRIGTMTAEAALEAVRPAVHYDSEMWLKLVGPQFLGVPEIIQACGVTEAIERTPLTLEKDGRTTTVVLEPLPASPDPAWVVWSDVSGTPKPLFLRNTDKTFWFEILPDRKALYAQVNSVQDGETETLAAFSARMVAAARAAGADRIVLDLRLNGGGNNYLGRGLVLALLGAENLNRYGRLYTIIGRNTFSAAVSLVSALERWSETIFVGEPTGNVPSQYGDSRRYLLPHSGLTVRLSSVYWRDAEVDERRPWVAPDIATPLAWADYAAGRDPALEAALAYEAPASLIDQLKDKYKWGGMRAAASHYYKHRNSPITAAVRTDDTLLAMADFLLAQKDADNAVEILRRAVAEYPDSAPCLLALGRRLVERGDGQGALGPLKKALALKPGDPVAAEWLEKAERIVRAKK
jgi:tetratricopeptide (TPR) repeat protein